MKTNAGRLLADLANGEGDVKLSKAFGELPALTRADILKDWLYEVTNLYGQAVADLSEEFNALRRARDAK